ncbi:AraC family ligand binding domain-containing protein [Niallia nealsonii]|uniref:AraC family ligand binding domain-containing protein n=1 Tax=Niallia nealsonii TaxID=115979 RepID=UPI002286EBC2|nr:AraC family ligand binding domain-containing protein [Niallia nealsonii]
MEAYHFHGIMQKFPNHFHEYYVIGFIKSGQRRLSCKNKEYIISTGDLIFFNPLDNHACEQIDNKTLDYRCLNIKPEIMRSLAKEISGEDYLPHFTIHVASRSEQTSLLHQLHQMIMNEALNIKKEETFYFFLEQLIAEYTETPKKTKMKTNEQKIKTVCQYIEAN